MQKKVYVSKQIGNETVFAPVIDRFTQVERLNDLVSLGWKIVRFVEEERNSYFILEKES